MLTVIFSNTIVITIGFLDIFMISDFDLRKINLSAIGIGAEIWFSFQSIYVASTIVFGILYSQYNGGKNYKSFLELFKINIWISFVLAFLSSLIMYLSADSVVGIFVNDGGGYSNNDLREIHEIAVNYVKIISIGNIFISMAVAILNTFTMIGKIKYELISSIIALLINAILNWLFIYQFKLGAEGAGWASITAYILEFFFAIIVIFLNRKIFKEIGSFFRIKFSLFKETLKRWPIFFANIIFIVSLAAQTVIFTKIWSTELIKSLAISYSVSSIMFTVFPAINKAVKIIIGEDLGKSNFEKAWIESKMLYKISFYFLLLVSIIGIAISFVLPNILLNEKQAIEISRNIIIIFAVSVLITGSISFFSACLESGGIQIWPNIFNYFGQILLLIPTTLILGYTTSLSFSFIFAISQSTNIILLVVLLTMYRKRKWLINLNNNINVKLNT
ncbi:MAG: MATE family efflux transporter [Mycoplasmatales bacterium]|nr:MATE family efflux transporter [Mycoplasmatales bacterium]